MTAKHELAITRVHALRYHMPLKRAYGTARGLTTAGINFLVRVTADSKGEVIEGIGECQPRHALTGDGGKDRVAAWGFLCAAADRLNETVLRFSDRASAVSEVRRIMAEMSSMAAQHSDESNRAKPFRGTQLGIEVALLDLASRALRLQVSELLGKNRDDIGITISTISSSTDLAAVPGKVLKQARFPMTRVKGTGDIDYDLRLLEVVAATNRSVGREKPLWIDINEAMGYDGCVTLVRELAERMSTGTLPKRVIVEGLLPKAEFLKLPKLQRIADEACQNMSRQDLDLRVMPDEGLWDKTDLAKLVDAGGCRAINIKAPKAGGLLASLDLAEAAVAADPDLHISIGGMIGTSDITAWALHNLARAMPRIDYLTAVPPQNVQARISDPLTRYVAPGSNVIASQTDFGLGTRLREDKIASFVEAEYVAGASPKARPAAQGRFAVGGAGATAARLVRELGLSQSKIAPFIFGLPPQAIDSYLLEAAALEHGLAVARLSPSVFFACREATGAPLLGFHGSAPMTNSKAGRVVAENRVSSRAALQLAGLSVPEGREFDVSAVERAITFAKRVGYPVVVRAANGHGANSVITDLGSSAAVRDAIASIGSRSRRARTFVLEKHVVGEGFRVLVAGGRPIAVLDRQRGREVTEEADPIIGAVAARAVAAMPGIDHASVDLILDHSGQGGRSPVVVDVDATPFLAQYEYSAEGRSRRVANEIVSIGLQCHAATPPAPTDASARIRLLGVAHRTETIDHLKMLADLLGLAVSLEDQDATVVATLGGRSEFIALLPVLMMNSPMPPDLAETAYVDRGMQSRGELA